MEECLWAVALPAGWLPSPPPDPFFRRIHHLPTDGPRWPLLLCHMQSGLPRGQADGPVLSQQRGTSCPDHLPAWLLPFGPRAHHYAGVPECSPPKNGNSPSALLRCWCRDPWHLSGGGKLAAGRLKPAGCWETARGGPTGLPKAGAAWGARSVCKQPAMGARPVAADGAACGGVRVVSELHGAWGPVGETGGQGWGRRVPS